MPLSGRLLQVMVRPMLRNRCPVCEKFHQVDTETILISLIQPKLEMWANAQRDGCPAEYTWHPLFNPQSLADAHY